MRIKDVMKNISALPKIVEALHRGREAHVRLNAIREEVSEALRKLNAEAAKQFEIMEQEAKAIAAFFGQETVKATPLPIKLAASEELANSMIRELLPEKEPRKKFEKVVALLGASKAGLTVREMAEVWTHLDWDEWWIEDEDLERTIRDAISTARGRGIKIEHTGGRDGKFLLPQHQGEPMGQTT